MIDFKNRFHFHVVIKTEERDWLSLSKLSLWLLLNSIFQVLYEELECNAIVLMGNHIHFLCSSHKSEVYYEIHLIKLLLSQRLSTDLNSRIFPITHFKQYKETYKYIYRNPVDAGLAAYVEDYMYSSLKHLLSGTPFACSTFDTMNLLYNPRMILRWLNNDFELNSYLRDFSQ